MSTNVELIIRTMKGINIGEFEELILLTVGVLYPEAYGVGIKNEISERTDRRPKLSAVHAGLQRLQDKGLLKSEFGEATKVRGGKRKKLFQITAQGSKVLAETRAVRNELWDEIPKVALLNYTGF